MEIRHLKYFLEVARYNNFSKAADAVHVTQPTLSRAIMELEEELDAPLFRRSNKIVELTPFGEQFLEKAAAAVDTFDDIQNMKVSDSTDISGSIYIGLPPITAATSFGQILGNFKAKYPNISLSLFEQGPKQIEKMLMDGLLDFGVFLPSDEQNLSWKWFEQDLHSVIMHPDNPLARKEQIDYEDLKDENLIIYNHDYLVHNQVLNGFKEKGILPHVALETVQSDLMLMLAESGFGIAIMPTKFCERLTKYNYGLTSRPLNDDRLKMNLALVSKKGQHLSVAASIFKKEFENHLKQSGFCFNSEQ